MTYITSKDGWIDYNDVTTVGTPIVYVAPNAISLTNDGAGIYSNSSFKPYKVTKLWNTTTNRFDFSELNIGDEVTLRIDIIVTTSANNQIVTLSLRFDIGGFPYELGIHQAHFKTAGTYNIVETERFYIGNVGTKNNPGDVRFVSDANSTITVNGFFISVKRR